MTDYRFYQDEYGGSLFEEDFLRLRGRAEARLAALTQGRSRRSYPETIQRSVHMALCSLIDAMDKVDSGGELSAESNDGLSVSYAARTPKSEEKREYTAVARYLAWTGLLDRRMGAC